MCEANNGEPQTPTSPKGDTAAGQFEVHVLVQEPPYFTKEPNRTVIANVGDSVEQRCAGDGRPKPNVFWRRVSST